MIIFNVQPEERFTSNRAHHDLYQRYLVYGCHFLFFVPEGILKGMSRRWAIWRRFKILVINIMIRHSIGVFWETRPEEINKCNHCLFLLSAMRLCLSSFLVGLLREFVRHALLYNRG
jgi:hypothetical protein